MLWGYLYSDLPENMTAMLLVSAPLFSLASFTHSPASVFVENTQRIVLVNHRITLVHVFK